MLPAFKGPPRELRITMHLIWGSLRTYASASVLEQRNEAICLTTAKAFPPFVRAGSVEYPALSFGVSWANILRPS